MKYSNKICLTFLFAITLSSLSCLDVKANLIDEIVVTASKTESNILTTQGNIASIDAEEIKFLGSHNPGEIINRLPGIYISQGSGQEHLTSIRTPIQSGGAGAGSF
jgi:outer membrane cobalamin receptor